MGIRVALHHRTQYKYAKAVALGPQTIQLRPTPHCRTPILSYALGITPADGVLKWQLDPHANYMARALFSAKTSEFSVDVDLTADLTPVNPFDFVLEPGFETFPFDYPTQLAKDLEPYRSPAPAGPLLRIFLANISRAPQSTIAFLVGLNQRVRDEVSYTVRLEHGVQTTEETLTQVPVATQPGFSSRSVATWESPRASSPAI
jgi:transglutaminase-like putative cysteine protease